jgi:hypothetical protein
MGIHGCQRVVELTSLLPTVADLLLQTIRPINGRLSLLLNLQNILLLRFGIRLESANFLSDFLESHRSGILHVLRLMLELLQTAVNFCEFGLSWSWAANSS